MRPTLSLLPVLLAVTLVSLKAEEIRSAEDIAYALTPKRSLRQPAPVDRQQTFSEKAYRELNPALEPATRGIRIVASGGEQQATVAVDASATLSFGNIRFKLDSVELADASSEAQLREIAKALLAFETKAFVLEGHTCDLGEDKHNQQLSEQRALAIGRFLRTQGVKCELVPFGYGEREPKTENTTEEARSQNRRVVIRLKN
jgi:outer membrane protein OmpA-like peptidoglycan-associated protein